MKGAREFFRLDISLSFFLDFVQWLEVDQLKNVALQGTDIREIRLPLRESLPE